MFDCWQRDQLSSPGFESTKAGGRMEGSGRTMDTANLDDRKGEKDEKGVI